MKRARHAEVAQQLDAQIDDDGIAKAEDRKELPAEQQEDRADRPGESSGRNVPRPGRRACSDRDGRRRGFCPAMAAAAPIMADGRPRDEGEELGVADRVRRLRLSALGQRAEEPEYRDAGNVSSRHPARLPAARTGRAIG